MSSVSTYAVRSERALLCILYKHPTNQISPHRESRPFVSFSPPPPFPSHTVAYYTILYHSKRYTHSEPRGSPGPLLFLDAQYGKGTRNPLRVCCCAPQDAWRPRTFFFFAEFPQVCNAGKASEPVCVCVGFQTFSTKFVCKI